ncbi:MAG TPA: DUF5681 domain-containing protein [Burkholderiaceae bacterium]|nr:DUF5681 domain-containing protein [Burkholderiaceae bacterium]
MATVKKSAVSENRQETDKRKAPKTAFKKGVSGNPGGRPKKTPEQFELESACKMKAAEALDVMVNLMANARQDSVKLQAALAIIERGHGKPLQRSEVRTGELDGLPHDELKQLRDALLSISGTGTVQGAFTAGEGRATH